MLCALSAPWDLYIIIAFDSILVSVSFAHPKLTELCRGSAMASVCLLPNLLPVPRPSSWMALKDG